jgi:hypothetical protein
MYRVVSMLAAGACVEAGHAWFTSDFWKNLIHRSLGLIQGLCRASDDEERQKLMLLAGFSLLQLSSLLGSFLIVICAVLACLPLLMGLDEAAVNLYVAFLGVGSLGWMLLRSKVMRR